MLLVFGEDDIAVGVLDDVEARFGLVGRVDAGGDAAGEDGAEVRDEPLDRVEAKDADSMASLEAELDERLGRRLDEVVVVAIRDGLPLTARLVLEGLAITKAARARKSAVHDAHPCTSRFSKATAMPSSLDVDKIDDIVIIAWL